MLAILMRHLRGAVGNTSRQAELTHQKVVVLSIVCLSDPKYVKFATIFDQAESQNMENPEEILHILEEFAKLKPKDIPRELEEYLCFVARTGDPVYQWSVIKSLFREKLISVITEFYESCPSVEIPPCPNVDIFNYDSMKSFILEKLDTFVAAPFTVQRICELLTTPRKEYNRIDKYMRALEKNILVVSTTEPGNHRTPENGDGFVNGIETEHVQEATNDINIEEMDDTPAWPQKSTADAVSFQSTSKRDTVSVSFPADSSSEKRDVEADTFSSESAAEQESSTSTDTVITSCCPAEEQPYVSIERVGTDSVREEVTPPESDVSVTITSIPAAVQKRRDSIEPPTEQTSSEDAVEKNESEEIDSSSESTEDITISKIENEKSEPAEEPTCAARSEDEHQECDINETVLPTVEFDIEKKQDEPDEADTTSNETLPDEKSPDAVDNTEQTSIECDISEEEKLTDKQDEVQSETKLEIESVSSADESTISDEVASSTCSDETLEAHKEADEKPKTPEAQTTEVAKELSPEEPPETPMDVDSDPISESTTAKDTAENIPEM